MSGVPASAELRLGLPVHSVIPEALHGSYSALMDPVGKSLSATRGKGASEEFAAVVLILTLCLLSVLLTLL